MYRRYLSIIILICFAGTNLAYAMTQNNNDRSLLCSGVLSPWVTKDTVQIDNTIHGSLSSLVSSDPIEIDRWLSLQNLIENISQLSVETKQCLLYLRRKNIMEIQKDTDVVYLLSFFQNLYSGGQERMIRDLEKLGYSDAGQWLQENVNSDLGYAGSMFSKALSFDVNKGRLYIRVNETIDSSLSAQQYVENMQTEVVFYSAV